MPLTTPFFYNFNGGEISKSMISRLDLPKYSSSCLRINEFIPMAQGSITRAPGTIKLGPAKNPLGKAAAVCDLVRLISYTLDDTTTYELEFGHLYMRVWKDDVLVHTVSGVNLLSTTNMGFVSKIGTDGSGNGNFHAPTGICSDGTHLYIADTLNNRIVKRLASDLSFVAAIGTYGTGNDQFNSPYDIATDGTNLFVADYGNGRIVKRLCSNLSYISKIGTIGSGNDQFNCPAGVTYYSGNIYISDSANYRIVKRTSADAMVYVSKIGTNGTGDDQFGGPRGLTNDGTHLYIADSNNNRIVKRLMSDLSYVAKAGTAGTGDDNFNIPVDVANDGTHLYVVDRNNHRVVKRLASTLAYVSQVGSFGTGDGNFNYPQGITVDAGYLYIMDTSSSRLVKHLASSGAAWSSVGNVTDSGSVQILSAGSTPAEIYQTVTTVAGTTYEISIGYATGVKPLGAAVFFGGKYLGYLGNDKHHVEFDGITYQTYKFHVVASGTSAELRISDSGFGGCSVKNVFVKVATPYSATTIYDGGDVIDLKYAQFDMKLYLAHGSYPLHRITQYADDDWLVTNLIEAGVSSLLMPPPTFEEETVFLNVHLDVSGTTVTAFKDEHSGSDVAAAIFLASDVGRTIVYRDQKFLITGYTGTNTVTGIKVIGFTDAVEIPKNSWGMTASPVAILRIPANGGGPVNSSQTWATDTGVAVPSFRKDVEGYTDVGRYIRVGGGVAVITGVTNSGTVVVTIIREVTDAPAANTDYGGGSWTIEESNWNADNGYPSSVCFHEQRLVLGGSDRFPQTVWSSKIGSYEDFYKGPNADDATEFEMSTESASRIRWLSSRKVLIAGTRMAEFRIEGSGGVAISAATPPLVKQESNYGCYPIQPVLTGQSIDFFDRTGKKYIDYEFTWEQDSFAGQQLNILSDQIFDSNSPSSNANTVRPVASAFQPGGMMDLIWISRLNASRGGTLTGITYDKLNKVFAWFSIDAQAGSVCSSPGHDGDDIIYYHDPSTDSIMRLDSKRDAFASNMVKYIGKPIATLDPYGYTSTSYLAMKAAGAADNDEIPFTHSVKGLAYSSGFAIPATHDSRHFYLGVGNTSEFITVPLEVETKTGNTVDKKKRIAELTIRVTEDSIENFSVNGETVLETVHGGEGDLGDAGNVKILRCNNLGEGQRLLPLAVVCDDILPLTIYSISGKMAVGD